MEGSTLLTGITNIITNLGTVGTFIWGLFGTFLEMILENALIAFPVMFAVLAGCVMLVVKLIRRFGVKGKR